jgi:hypothetical protein
LCLGDDVPLADVVVRSEGKSGPVLVTVSRTSDGQSSIFF